jgi:hypothetical protein
MKIKNLIIFLISVSCFWIACKKERFWNLPKNTPLVITSDVIQVHAKDATVAWEIKHNSGLDITRCGICLSDLSEEFDMSNSQVIDFTVKNKKVISPGTYQTVLTNLKEKNQYFVRSFASNAKGVSYGDILEFRTKKLAEVISDTVVNIGSTSATCSGLVVSDWGYPISERGVVWGLDSLPMKSKDVHSIVLGGLGFFSCDLTNLPIDKKLFYRAYAISESGIAYGNSKSFNTKKVGLALVSTVNVEFKSSFSLLADGKVFDAGGTSIIKRGFCYAINPNPTMSDSVVLVSGGIGDFTGIFKNLIAGETYYIRAYAINSFGVAYGNELSLMLQDTLPVLTTLSVADLTDVSFRSGGKYIRNKSQNISKKGLCWSTIGIPTVNSNTTNNGFGSDDFSAVIDGLSGNTTYFLRAYAINNIGIGYGNLISIQTLVTKTAPQIETVAPSTFLNFTNYSAVTRGNVISDGNDAVSARGTCWSIGSNPTLVDSFTRDGAGIGLFNSNLQNLLGNTTYYFRAYASNKKGTSYGNVYSFKTNAVSLPSISTVFATNVTSDGASSGGVVLNNGGAVITSKGVCWGKVSNPTIANSKTFDGSGNANFTSALTPLYPGITYYCRAYATNSFGTAYGSNITITTPAKIPTVTTTTVTSILQNTFTSGGTVTSDGGDLVTSRGICYSKTSTPTTSDSVVTSGSGVGAFISAVSGLIPNTTYYVRAFAINGAGAGYGSEIIVKTRQNGIPSLITVAPNNVTGNSAKSGGIIYSDSGSAIKVKGVCWSLGSNPTVANTRTSNGTGVGNFVSDLTNLTLGSRYYVRAYATNSVGTGYGLQYSFVTALTAPNLNSPLNSALVNSYFYLDWSCVSGATSYDLQFSRSSTFSGTVYALPKSPGGWLQMSGVHSGTQNSTCSSGLVTSDQMQTTTSASSGTYIFYWRVRAKTATVTGPWSSTATFKVIK